MWTGFKIINAHARGRRALRDSAKTEKQNHAQEKKEKNWYTIKEACENVYASLTYFCDFYSGNVRKEILIFLILFE